MCLDIEVGTLGRCSEEGVCNLPFSRLLPRTFSQLNDGYDKRKESMRRDFRVTLEDKK
jgi:hypothetical protein